MKKIRLAITGGTGFIGSEIIKQLSTNRDVEVIVLTRTAKVLIKENFVSSRVTDYSIVSLTPLLRDIDVIIHLAAIRGTEGRISDFHENETILENILISMHLAKVSSIILASSIAVYSDEEKIPWSEEILISPKTLYGISKASCEYLCQLYANKYNFRYHILRIAQVLGLGERRKGMMNIFIEQAQAKKSLTVIGKSLASRQYIYVKDLAKIFIKIAADSEFPSEIINIGMENAYSNYEIACLINEVLENKKEIIYNDSLLEKIRPSKMAVDKSITLLGIAPLDMREALFDIKRLDRGR